MCRQEEGEPVDSFITSLCCLAAHCNYCDLHDEIIRDWIVDGLRDVVLSEKLQTDPELTLDKAITMVQRTETVRGQQPIVRGNMNNCHTRSDEVDYGHPSRKQTATNNPTKKQSLVLISQLPMPARKDAPDAASFQHIHVIRAQLVKPSDTSVES